MATTKDWSNQVTYSSPVYTAYFAGGDGTDYCVHTPPPWAKRVTIINYGAAKLYVTKPALSGTAAAAATADAIALEASASGDGFRGDSVTLALVNMAGHGGINKSGTALSRTFSTFGADGATHKMRLIFDHGYGGA